MDRRFGISTHLFRDARLNREHLVQIAAHGFEAIEVSASRSHCDARDPQAVARLAEWLTDTGLELLSVHAPAGEPAGDLQAAIALAARIPYRFLVMHPGPPAAPRVITELAHAGSRLGVRIALDMLPVPPSPPERLVRLVEEELEEIDVGICLDYGHAHLMGAVGDAIETISGRAVTTHVHDNDGRHDNHLVPYAGTIDWDAAMMETQKIGYDGVLMFEVGGPGDPIETLARAVKARATSAGLRHVLNLFLILCGVPP